MKKFETLGRSLSKGEQKRIVGGDNVCVSCSGGNVMCAPQSSGCTAFQEYGEIWCSSGSGHPTVYRCNEQ